MAKISRNAPCPCGSRKKYKKCCMQKDEEKYAHSKKTGDTTNNVELNKFVKEQYTSGMFIEDELDLLSNSVVDLIKKGKFDKAEENCLKLLEYYPYVVDGFERSAMLYEARNEYEKAVEYYKKAADFMKENPGYDQELITFALNKVKQLS